MNCLKCGKKTTRTDAFCQECMEVMERYPVKPGTVAQIPNRSAIQAEKKSQPHKREPSPAEQLAHLRGVLRWMTVTVVILSLLLCLTAGILLHLINNDTANYGIGQNYITKNID